MGARTWSNHFPYSKRDNLDLFARLAMGYFGFDFDYKYCLLSARYNGLAPI